MPFQFQNRIINVLLHYGSDDLVREFELLAGNLNLSKMTYAQVKETTGMSEDDVLRLALAVRSHIDRMEGRG